MVVIGRICAVSAQLRGVILFFAPHNRSGMSEPYRKKLIEVALPLEAINRESQHEKSVPRRGHPATMHLWWARRPLAACRAVLFATIVDEPSSRPDLFPTEAAQDDGEVASQDRCKNLS
jgi:adenine-specific DNA methylase